MRRRLYQDRIGADAGRRCADCGAPYALTESELVFFVQRGLEVPRRCAPCRHARRAARQGDGAAAPGAGPDGGRDPLRGYTGPCGSGAGLRRASGG